MPKHILIHYSEIGLKGRNRGAFEKKLADNISSALQDFEIKVQTTFGRMIIWGDWSDEREIIKRLSFIPGIAFYSTANIIGWDLEKIKKEILNLVKQKKFTSFAIRAKRSSKDYSLKSMEVNEKIGRYLLDNLSGKKVDLGNPDLTCYIELTNKKAIIYFDKIKGLGGLPVGTAGKLISLISGGFDSPVAAFQMIRRGAEMTFVHFHSYPNTSKASLEKVGQLIRVLGGYQGRGKLYLIPFLNIQKEIFLKAPEKLRIILYRRFMVRIAEKIALKEKCQGLVTGDNLGQVASQTLENMAVISAAANLPIYRPLIGFDKDEIIKLSKKIGTHDLSAEPFDDCCSLFAPKRPEIKAKMREVEGAEEGLDIEKLVKEAIEGAEIKM